MGSLRTIALVILAISTFTFIALFGRLPAFRKTPISFLYRVVWVYFPNGVAHVDSLLFSGRLTIIWNKSGKYILYENHPLVLLFFIGLLAGGEIVFLPVAWPRITSVHYPWVPLVVFMPYFLLYKCVMTKSQITPKNHDLEIKRYPYDQVLFHAGYRCSTCKLHKPARSKHCKFCKACISRQDHHCVWLMNCVGANNYIFFLALLLSLSVLLIYGTCLGYSLLCQTLQKRIPADLQAEMQGWVMYFNIWAIVIQLDPRVGTVTLLMLMTAPLAMAFLVYHTYLVWAGMTTNESAKWSDWKEDIEDGFVFKSHRGQIPDAQPFIDFNDCPWPVTSDQLLVMDEEPPLDGYMLVPGTNQIEYRSDTDMPIDPRWHPVQSMKEIDNIYDLGFWNNLKDSAGISVRRKNCK